jgi:prepilin-type N-terminal cleavage/methylation domain-containing protein
LLRITGGYSGNLYPTGENRPGREIIPLEMIFNFYYIIEGDGRLLFLREKERGMKKDRSLHKRFPGGFTLLELMIVLGLLAIVSTIGYPLVQRVYVNGNLRSAARDLVGDFNQQKQRAMAGEPAAPGSRIHRIALDLGTNRYTLRRCTGSAIPCNQWDDLQVKNLSAFGNDIVFVPEGTNPTIFDFHPRGMVTFLDEVEGRIGLRNSRGSTAAITTNLSGRTSVEFHME